MILPLGSRNVMSRAFQRLTPLVMQAFAIFFHVFDGS